MKALLFSFLLISQVYAANLDRIFHSDSMKSFCKKIINQVSPGRWQSSRPLFAEGPEAVYTIIRDKNIWIVSAFDETGAEEILLKSVEPLRDIEYTEGYLWLAKRDSLLKYDLKTEKVVGPIHSHQENRSLGKHERIHALYAHEGKLFIAHGTLGVTSLDLTTHQYLSRSPLLTYQENGHRSKAMTLFGNGDEVFIGFDNTTQPTNRSRAFNGIVRTQLDDMSKYHGAAYDHRRVGILAFAWLRYHRENIIINNLGNLHIIAAEQVRKKKKIRPSWKPLRLEVNGEMAPASWSGKILTQNSQVYGCAEVMLDPLGRAERRGLATVFPL